MVDDRSAAERTVQIDNDRVRVSRRRFPPDAATGRHRHRHLFDYVIVPVLGGKLELDDVADANGLEFPRVEIELTDAGSA